MDFNLFKKIIDDAAQYSIECVDINGFGDPFTDKLLFKRLEYVRKKMPGAKIYISSTCFLMGPSMYDNVAKYIDILKISFFGMTEETYEGVHRGNLKFGKSLSNILGLLKKIKTLKKKPYTIGLFLAHEINKHEVDDWIKFWEPKLDEVFVWKPHNWAGSRNYRAIDHSKQVSCGRVFNGPSYVAVDGAVSICCWDFNKNLVIGDMKTQTIYDILHSETYKKLRKSHETNDFRKYICHDCCQTNPDPSVLLYSSNNERAVGKLTTNLKDFRWEPN